MSNVLTFIQFSNQKEKKKKKETYSMVWKACSRVINVLRYHLNDVILGEGIPFNRAYGMTAFEYSGTDQRYNRVFNQGMSNHTTLIMKKILDVYKGFEGLKVLVDVGGGIGVTLNVLTSKYPQIRGINFDLPHVVSDAPSYPGTVLLLSLTWELMNIGFFIRSNT